MIDSPVAPCAECGRPTSVLARSTAYEVVGFERSRGQGGTNHVLFRKRTGRVMCAGCVALKASTGNAQQGALL